MGTRLAHEAPAQRSQNICTCGMLENVVLLMRVQDRVCLDDCMVWHQHLRSTPPLLSHARCEAMSGAIQGMHSSFAEWDM